MQDAFLSTGLTLGNWKQHSTKTTAPAEEDDLVEIQTNYLRKMEEAIQLLPELRKSAYLEAVKQVPHLVETESPPIRFLKLYGSASEAAYHICSYWEVRKAIFGARAFLPMNQTGRGALDQDDIIHLDLGCFAFLQNSVFFHDPSRYVIMSEPRKLRLLFYLFSILSENEEIQKLGYVFVVPLSFTSSGVYFKVFEDVVFRAIPVRIKRVHLLCCPTQAEMRTFCSKFLPRALQEMANLMKRKEIIHVAVADKLQDFAKVMAVRGLPKWVLPEALGGTLSLRQSVLNWKRERLVSESSRYTNIVPLTACVTVSQEQQRSTFTDAGSSVSGWSDPGKAKYIAASFTPEHPGLDKSDHSEVCYPMESSLSESTHASTSKPGLPALHAVQQGKSERGRDIGDAREDRDNAVDATPSTFKWLREWEEALSAIPPEERRAYSEALQGAPHLVKTEPGTLSLLRAENFDACAAVRRAVTFWTRRKNIFGNRAFSPMNQTGEGALSQEELEILRTGFMMHCGRDSHGRSILVVTISRLASNKTYELFQKMERICFYFAYVACEDDHVTQKHGLVMLRVVDPLIYRGQLKHVAHIFSTCCGPFTIHTVVQGHSDSGFIQSMARPNSYGEGNVKQHFIHTGESVGEVVAKLRSHGISEKSLPSWLGGPWTVEKFECWCRERVAIERERADNSSTISTHTIDARPKKRQAENAQTDAGIGEDNPKELSDGLASFKEPKLTAGSRPHGMSTQPFPGYDKKKGCPP